MNNELKQILLNLAKLPHTDQQWVLKQLTAKQNAQFNKLQGHSLLRDARKFRKLSAPQIPMLQQEIPLPEACQQLHQEDPLYIAIILQQGQFSWEQQFLATCPQKHPINELVQTEVKALKPATKSLVFQQWQAQLSFQDHLETIHG
ncbi:hypothetical protein [Legionella drancourtii]|uniref:Uncharacterized protein n=1 Tax=Legionella drancourtii LLAP12 TaxID=658187 RepID=G9EQX9_9GAMM|nr:hypothetical protein [Legionella drancourtii]EHL30350.1 hypothetical protein LDG_7683 [Legionella drancourtii LLAP12]